MQPTTPPGWYPDPHQPGAFRWFDGNQWTAHVAPMGTQPDRGPSSTEHWLLPVGRSWQSITAGYLGLLAVVVFPLAPFSIGFGIWGLVLAHRAGGHGRGRCWTGIIGGFLGLLVLVAVLTS